MTAAAGNGICSHKKKRKKEKKAKSSDHFPPKGITHDLRFRVIIENNIL